MTLFAKQVLPRFCKPGRRKKFNLSLLKLELSAVDTFLLRFTPLDF